MKHMVCMILLVLSLPIPAFASRECDWAVQVDKDEDYRGGVRNARINQLNGLMATDSKNLNDVLMPLYQSWTHTMSVYNMKEQTAKDAQLAVKQAIILAQEAIVANKGLHALLDQLKDDLAENPGSSLSDLLRKKAKSTWFISPWTRTSLNQLANAVALVESQQKEFMESEKELLERYLGSNASLSEGLFTKLNELNEKLTSDLNQLHAGRTQDQQKADDLGKQVSDAQNRISAYTNEIASLQKANAEGAANRERWAIHKWCPRWDPDEHRPFPPVW